MGRTRETFVAVDIGGCYRDTDIGFVARDVCGPPHVGYDLTVVERRVATVPPLHGTFQERSGDSKFRIRGRLLKLIGLNASDLHVLRDVSTLGSR